MFARSLIALMAFAVWVLGDGTAILGRADARQVGGVESWGARRRIAYRDFLGLDCTIKSRNRYVL